MLVGMNAVVESGNHNPDTHKGGALEVFVKQLSSLGVPSVQSKAGDPKSKNCNANGPPTQYRLGSNKSTVTGKKKEPSKCSFCGGNEGGKFHASKLNCPLRRSYGFCIDMKKKNNDNATVGDDIETIFAGNHRFRDVSTMDMFTGHHFIDDDLPSGTMGVIIKA